MPFSARRNSTELVQPVRVVEDRYCRAGLEEMQGLIGERVEVRVEANPGLVDDIFLAAIYDALERQRRREQAAIGQQNERVRLTTSRPMLVRDTTPGTLAIRGSGV